MIWFRSYFPCTKPQALDWTKLHSENEPAVWSELQGFLWTAYFQEPLLPGKDPSDDASLITTILITSSLRSTVVYPTSPNTRHFLSS